MGLEIVLNVDGVMDPEMASASRIEVYEALGETTYYAIRYPVDISEGDITMAREARVDPGSTISLMVPIENNNECLVKGPVYSQRLHLQHGGEGSWVEILGADTSITMDREVKSEVWTDVSDGDTVTSILGSYGLASDIYTTNGRHLEAKHTLVQRSSDLQFIRRLARRNGCLFWITCDGSGMETAHFQRPQLDGMTAADLTINRELPNLQTLDISWDVERPTSVEGTQLDLNNKENLEGTVALTPQTILGALSLQAITGDTRSVLVSAPVDDAGDMQARGEGALIEADWFIRGSCRTSLHRLGKLVRAHTVVGINGAGSRHSGRYLVSGVRHIIDAAAHVMEVELIRNGWEA